MKNMVIIFNTEGFIILSSQVFLWMHFVLSNILITYTMQKIYISFQILVAPKCVPATTYLAWTSAVTLICKHEEMVEI